MSENNKINELEFDDEIDFDGLDDFNDDEEYEGENIGSSAKNIENNENVVSSPETEEDVEDNDEEDDEPLCEEKSVEVGIEDECEVIKENTTEQVNSYTVHKESSATECFYDKSETENVHSDVVINRMYIINTAISAVTLCAVAVGIAFGYNYINSIEKELEIKSAEIAELERENRELESDYMQVMNTVEENEEKPAEQQLAELEKGKIKFYDTAVGYSWTPVLEGIRQHEYKTENFSVDNRERISYTEDGEASSYFGIDVSSYQGDINWQLVKEDNVEFAFLRIGYRGYGEEGKMCPDENFIDNYAYAHDAGIDLGVYFFSQAISVDEAIEEADYVLSLLEGRTLEYPIVFDWETIQTGDPEDIPRTEDVTPETLTLSAIAFCETIKSAGYDAMIYTNKKLATIKYDMRLLQDYPIWLAYYDTELDYIYDFDIWQYGTGQVEGIDGEVDVNVAIIR